MRDKVLRVFGTFAIFATVFARNTGRPPVSVQDAEMLLTKLNQKTPVITKEDIPKLMAMKLAGNLPEDLHSKFAEAILAMYDNTMKTAITQSLSTSTPLTEDQQALAWAMYMTPGELTSAQKDAYEKLRLARLPKVEKVEPLSEADFEALKTKLVNQENLIDDEINQAIMNPDRINDDALMAWLAEYILTKYAAIKVAVIAKLKTREALTKVDRSIFWALKEQNDVPEGAVLTRKEQKEEAMAIVAGLSDPEALKTKLATAVTDDTVDLTPEEITNLKALKKVGQLDQTQKDQLYQEIAKKVDDETFERLIDAIQRKIYTEDNLELIAVLMKVNPAKFDNVLQELEEAGIIGGVQIKDVITGDEDIPTEFGLSTEEKELLEELRGLFNDVLDFKHIKSKKMLKKLIEAFRQLTPEQKNILNNLTAAATSLSTADIEGLNLEFMELFPDSKIDEFIGDLDEKKKISLCRLGFESEPEFYNKVADVCNPLITTIADGLEEGNRHRLARNFMWSKKNPSKIADSDLTTLIEVGAVFEDMLQRIDKNDLLEKENLLLVVVENGGGEAAMDKIRDSLSVLTGEQVKTLVNSKARLRTTDVEQLSAQALKDAAADLSDIDNELKAKVAQKIRGSLPNIAQASADDLYSLQMVGGLDDLHDVSDSQVEGMLPKIKEKKTNNKKDLREFSKRMMEVPKYSDPKQMTTENIEDIAAIVGDLTGDYFDNLPVAAVVDATKKGAFRNVNDLGTDKARRIGQLYFQENGFSVTAEEIVKSLAAETLASLEPTVLERIPETVVADSRVFNRFVDNIDSMSAPSQQALINQVKIKIPTDLPVTTLGGLCKSLSLSIIEAWPDTVIDEIKAAGGNLKLDCGWKQLAVLAKKMVSLYGEPGSGNDKYDSETWNALYILIPGLSVDLIAKIPVDNKFPALVRKVLRDNKMAENKLQVLLGKLKTYSDTNKPTTTEGIADVEPALKLFDKAALNEFSTDLRNDVIKALKELPKTDIPKSILRDHAKFAVDFLTGASSGPINTDAAKNLGILLCDIGERVSDLTDEAAKEESSIMFKCLLKDSAVRKLFVAKLMSALGITDISTVTKEQVDAIDFIYNDLSESEKARVPIAVASEVLDSAVNNHLELEKEIISRNNILGEENNIAQVKKEGDDKIQDFLRARATEETAGTGGSTTRRRRSTNSLTCSAIQSAGQMARAFTEAQLTSLSDAVILECLLHLGRVLEWSDAQKHMLADRLKTATVLGTDLSLWQSTKIQDSGSMLEGLSVPELGMLPWTTTLVGVHGSRSTWTPEQLTAVVAKWLQSVKGDNAGTITADELNVMGHFICGLTVGQINPIPASVYQEAMGKVGEAMGCTEEQAQAFATKAKAVLGNVNTWSVDNVIAVQNVLAGISGTELSSLPASHLTELQPSTIAILSPNTLSGLTETQLKGLSKAQALKVTEEQYKAFNEGQRNAIVEAGGFKYTTDKAGAGINKMPAISGTLVIMVTLFMM